MSFRNYAVLGLALLVVSQFKSLAVAQQYSDAVFASLEQPAEQPLPLPVSGQVFQELGPELAYRSASPHMTVGYHSAVQSTECCTRPNAVNG